MTDLLNIKPPNNLFRKIRDEAPLITLSENYGRSGGYYGDEDSHTRGYRGVLIYIQKGLGNYSDLVLNTVKLILSVQSEVGKKYPLVPFCFGDGDKLKHEGKYFDLGYSNDRFNDRRIADVLLNLSGNEPGYIPAVITELFPRVGTKSLYHGKTGFDRDDLLVFIGRKDEVVFSRILKQKITYNIKKHMLFVEIETDRVNWKFKIRELKFFKNI